MRQWKQKNKKNGQLLVHLASDRSDPSVLWHQQGIVPHTNAALFFGGSFSVGPREAGASVKIRVDQEFVKYSDQPVFQQPPCHLQSHLDRLSSPSWCSLWTSGTHPHHVLMSRCIDTQRYNWLISYLCSRPLNVSALIKRQVSVWVCNKYLIWFYTQSLWVQTLLKKRWLLYIWMMFWYLVKSTNW